jgi:hypothetical protein
MKIFLHSPCTGFAKFNPIQCKPQILLSFLVLFKLKLLLTTLLPVNEAMRGHVKQQGGGGGG